MAIKTTAEYVDFFINLNMGEKVSLLSFVNNERMVLKLKLKNKIMEKEPIKKGIVILEGLIKEIADDLIKTAAKRFLSKSPPIKFDLLNYDKFISTFPFVETEDQFNAIEDIKSDFLKKYPSDRLIIGDVAYGKSEIIIRAIFSNVKPIPAAAHPE